jgi:hypothetical protein
MIQLSELIGHDTLDVTSAESNGKVTGIGLVGDRIVSVGIGGDTVEAVAVRGFDGDVLTYEPVDGSADDGLPEPIDPRGSRVLDLHGDGLGVIADLMITDDGVVDSILLEGGHALRGTRLRVVGSYAAIVEVEAAS